MKAHGQFYDFLIVHPARRDPIARRKSWRRSTELVYEAGPWRLYRVVKPKEAGEARPGT